MAPGLISRVRSPLKLHILLGGLLLGGLNAEKWGEQKVQHKGLLKLLLPLGLGGFGWVGFHCREKCSCIQKKEFSLKRQNDISGKLFRFY